MNKQEAIQILAVQEDASPNEIKATPGASSLTTDLNVVKFKLASQEKLVVLTGTPLNKNSKPFVESFPAFLVWLEKPEEVGTGTPKIKFLESRW